MKGFHEIKRFSFTGVISTAIGAVLIILFQFLAANPYLANFLGYSIGGAISYCIHARYTFRSRMSLRSIILFGLVASSAYLVNLFILKQSLLRMGKLPAQAIAIPSYAAYSYILQSRLSFPASRR